MKTTATAEYQRRYRAANKERLVEKKRRYRAANKERLAERDRRYYAANKERLAERDRRYYAANKERVAERMRRYYAANKERVAERTRLATLTQSAAFSAAGSLFADLGKHDVFTPEKTYPPMTMRELAEGSASKEAG